MQANKARIIRSILFVGCVFAVLLSSIVNYATLPDPGTIERQSYLEGRLYQNLPEFKAKAFLAHEYQDSFEQFAADSIPYRDSVMLGNAQLQRFGIESSNVFYGFRAYPTFFGSTYLACPEDEAIVEYPTSQSIVTPERLEERRAAVEAAVREYPDINWRFALVDRSRNSDSNPAHDLVSKHADYEYYRTGFLDKLPAECPYIDLSVGDSDRYFDYFFHTDHHAQIQGAIDAYLKICESFARKPIDNLQIERVYDGPFYGSEARSGLIVSYSDVVDDVVKPSEKLVVIMNGKKLSMPYLNNGFSKDNTRYEPSERFANAYAEWFHTDVGEIHLINKQGEGSLLIIGDSFTNNVDYLFAYSYHDVFILDPRHYQGTLQSFLEKNQVEDALFLVAGNTLVNSDIKNFLEFS
ncbi:MAG: hypothetical protein Q4C36_01595 [Coriobacteriia bacterium]|nr:hypothetical protein [Coriobacteriia bacterium]